MKKTITVTIFISSLFFVFMNFSNYEAYVDHPIYDFDDTCDYVTTCISHVDKVIEELTFDNNRLNKLFSNGKDFYDFVDFVLERMELLSDPELKRLLFFFFIYLVNEYEKHKEIPVKPRR